MWAWVQTDFFFFFFCTAVGEGDNLGLSQQLKAARHEAAHARWERERATNALAKMRNKLKTAQSTWEEERGIVQARILELEVEILFASKHKFSKPFFAIHISGIIGEGKHGVKAPTQG